MKKILYFLALSFIITSASAVASTDDFPDWDFDSNGRGAEVELEYDKKNVKDGDVAICITPDSNSGEYKISQTVNTQVGKKYTFSANIKGKPKGVKLYVGSVEKTLFNGTWNNYISQSVKNYEATSQTTTVSIVISDNTEILYLDSMSFTDDETSENLLKNNSFEAGKDTTPPAEVSGIDITPGIGSLTIRWVDPQDADFEKVIITPLNTENEPDGEPVEIEKGVKKAEITGLLQYTEYSFLIQTVDNTLGTVSEGVIITEKTAGATYIASDYIIESGKVTCNVKNLTEEEFTAELFMFVYDKDGKLDSVISSQIQPIEQGKDIDLTVQYTIPQDGYAEIFLWDGMFKMRSLKESQVIE